MHGQLVDKWRRSLGTKCTRRSEASCCHISFIFWWSKASPADLNRLLAFPPPGDPKFEESRSRRAPPPPPPPSPSLLPRLFVAAAAESREAETPDAVLLLFRYVAEPCAPFLVGCIGGGPEMKAEGRVTIYAWTLWIGGGGTNRLLRPDRIISTWA